MTEAGRTEPSRRLGEPLPADAAALAARAAITAADIAAAAEVWRKYAPERYRGLVDATTDPDDDEEGRS